MPGIRVFPSLVCQTHDMSENLRRFTQAIYAFDAVVQRMPSDAWDRPTPCAEWDAAALVDHQCAVLNGVAEIARTGAMAAPTPSPPGQDPVATWTTCRDELLSALDRQGALQQTGPFWFRAATVDELTAMVTWDPVTHAWDLATAGAIDHGLSPELIEATIATVEPRIDMLAESGRTAAALDVPDDADALTRYLAMVGRNC